MGITDRRIGDFLAISLAHGYRIHGLWLYRFGPDMRLCALQVMNHVTLTGDNPRVAV